jgi:uncharacterized protein (TIGR01244 family)
MRTWLPLCLLLAVAPVLAGDPPPVKIDLDDIAPAAGNAAGGQPSADELKTLKAQGFVAVVDLRGPDENRGIDEVAAAEAAGLAYTPLPITGLDAVNVENARTLGELLDELDGPVYVHCGSGNRVGALVALLEADRGASVDEALEAGRAAGLTRLEGHVKDTLEAAGD